MNTTLPYIIIYMTQQIPSGEQSVNAWYDLRSVVPERFSIGNEKQHRRMSEIRPLPNIVKQINTWVVWIIFGVRCAPGVGMGSKKPKIAILPV